MKTRYLSAILLPMVLFAAAHAQTGNGFLCCLRYRGPRNSLTIQKARNSLLLLPGIIVLRGRPQFSRRRCLKSSMMRSSLNPVSYSGQATQLRASELQANPYIERR